MLNFFKIFIKNCWFFFRIVKDVYKRLLEVKDLIEFLVDLKLEFIVLVFEKVWCDDLN